VFGCVQVKEAFRIITEDVKVKAILVNVFGGIVNCATIANGIVNACKSIDLKVSGSVSDPDPGAGAFLTPVSGMGKKPRSGSRICIRYEHPGSYFREQTVFGAKILKSFDADPDAGPESF
jgi:hypothetical protein